MTTRPTRPRRLRYGVQRRRQGHCSMATRHNIVVSSSGDILQGSNQSIPIMQSPDHVRKPAKSSIIPRLCVVQGDLQRSLARHSAPERCCTTTTLGIQTPTHPERASGLRNCILRAVPRCISQSRNPAMLPTSVIGLEIERLRITCASRAASFAASAGRRATRQASLEGDT